MEANINRDADGMVSELQSCAECEVMTDDWFYQYTGINEDGTDYTCNDTILCRSCHDERCVRDDIPVLD